MNTLIAFVSKVASRRNDLPMLIYSTTSSRAVQRDYFVVGSDSSSIDSYECIVRKMTEKSLKVYAALHPCLESKRIESYDEIPDSWKEMLELLS